MQRFLVETASLQNCSLGFQAPQPQLLANTAEEACSSHIIFQPVILNSQCNRGLNGKKGAIMNNGSEKQPQNEKATCE